MPEAKDPRIPLMTFQKSACGRYFYFNDDRVCVVIVLPVVGVHDGHILTCFYGGVLSNFPAVVGASWTINGKPVAFKNAEQVFKAACVCGHIDPADETSPKALNLLTVLNAVMSAKSPNECKCAPGGIPRDEFDSAMWDEISPSVMFHAQLWKLMDPVYFGFCQHIGQSAVAYGIPLCRCFFFEAAGLKDVRWGTGLTVGEMFDAITSNLDDPKWHFTDGAWDAQLPFDGKNLLGKSLDSAFCTAFGSNGIRLTSDVEIYREFVGSDFPVFVYHPSSSDHAELDPLSHDQGHAKRARTGSDGSVDDALRTSSDSDSDCCGSGVMMVGRSFSE